VNKVEYIYYHNVSSVTAHQVVDMYRRLSHHAECARSICRKRSKWDGISLYWPREYHI